MNSSAQDYVKIDIREGLYIYKQPSRSKNWYVYFWDAGIKKPVKESLKTASENEAKDRAYEMYLREKYGDQAQVRARNHATVKSICAKIISNYENEVKSAVTEKSKKYIKRENNRRIKYLNIFCDVYSEEIIQNINHAKLKLFYKKFDKVISKSEFSYLNQSQTKIFDYAIENSLIEQRPEKPKIKFKTVEERVSFRASDLAIFYKHLKTRKRQSGLDTDLNKILLVSMMIYEKTGIRPGEELYQIKANDIQLENIKNRKVFTLKIHGGKRATRDKVRRVIPIDDQVAVYLACLLNYQINGLIGLSDGELMLDKDKLFKFFRIYKDLYIVRHRNGNQIDLTSAFETAREEIKNKLTDKNVVLYSIRHYYINKKLLENSVSMSQVASHCGTSLKTIDDYYAKLSSLVNADYFAEESVTFLTEQDILDLKMLLK